MYSRITLMLSSVQRVRKSIKGYPIEVLGAYWWNEVGLVEGR